MTAVIRRTAGWLARLVVAVLAVALSGCMAPKSIDSVGPPGSVVWLDNGWLYFVRTPVSDGFGTLWRMRSEGPAERVTVGSGDCPSNSIESVFRLDANRLGLVRSCSVGSGTVRMLSEYDVQFGSFVDVGRVGLLASGFWTTGATQGTVAYCATIVRTELSGANLVTPESSVRNFGGCGGPEEVIEPVFLSGSDALYFYSPAALGRTGDRLPGARWSLRRWRGAPDKVTTIISDVDAVGGLAAVQGGGAVAMCATLAGVDGLWLVSLGGGEPRRLAAFSCSAVAMSPDQLFVGVVIDDEIKILKIPR